MRLLCVLKDQDKVREFSHFLTKERIENQLEVETNNDWGSSDYGNSEYKIWIYQEDQFDTAIDWLNKYEENPKDPLFQSKKILPIIELTPLEEDIKPKEEVAPITKWDKQPIGKITYYLFLTCCALLLLSTFTEPSFSLTKESQKTPAPVNVLMSPIEKTFLYDYPAPYALIDKLIQAYGLNSLQHPEELPPEAQYLLKKLSNMPYWQGIYEKIVLHVKNYSAPWDFNAPLFEKIREGEIWRLFTPCLLHYDMFHLFFNMIWLLVLGKQIEQRIKRGRYILFIIIAAIVSNTAQYLMSGPNFLGFSGVLSAMIGFIWMRKKYAAWEGYQLQDSTIKFITFFILFMLCIQCVSFILEIYSQNPFGSGIANTAHIVGAITGILLGRINYFSWKH